MLLLTASCNLELDSSEENETTPSEEQTESQFSSISQPNNFRHVLKNRTRADGKIPLLDVLDSEKGKRYAYSDSLILVEGQKDNYESRLKEFEIRQISFNKLRNLRASKGPIIPMKASGILDTKEIANEKFSTGSHSFLIRFAKAKNVDSVKETLDRLVAANEINSWKEYQNHREVLTSNRKKIIRSAFEPIRQKITEIGAVVVSVCEQMYCAEVNATKNQIKKIERLAGLEKISLNVSPIDNVADGVSVIKGMQMEQYLPSNGGSTTTNGTIAYDGQNRGSSAGTTPIRVAMVEGAFPNDDHPGFYEYSALTTNRIKRRYICGANSSGCLQLTSNNTPESMEEWHPTFVAGLFVGDLRDEQDNSFGSGLYSEQARSGYSGEAEIDVFHNDFLGSGTIRAFNTIIAQSGIQATIINYSQSGGDSSCLGQDSISRAANDVFEDGKLIFNAPSDNRGSPTNCAVRSPGSAIGVFTVGGMGEVSDPNTPGAVKAGNVWSKSPWGGGSNERSIIDGLTPACRGLGFRTNDSYGLTACGTSFASPTYASAMTNFVDWYINHTGWADIRNEPGRIFSNALLFGDRATGPTTYSTSKFSHLWGAGRMRARRYDTKGMDAPSGYTNGWTCVAEGDEISIPVNNGNALSYAVDDLKAVVWWYDKRHGSATNPQLDDIDLELWANGSQIAGSWSGADNKERVYNGNMGGKTATLKLLGYNVSSTDSGCAGTAMKVWYAYFWEDDARNDADGPSAINIEREQQ